MFLLFGEVGLICKKGKCSTSVKTVLGIHTILQVTPTTSKPSAAVQAVSDRATKDKPHAGKCETLMLLLVTLDNSERLYRLLYDSIQPA